jgi:hypothetical protein
MPVVHAGFKQFPGPDHRNCEAPIAAREMQLVNHIRRHDWDAAATQCHSQLGIIGHI